MDFLLDFATDTASGVDVVDIRRSPSSLLGDGPEIFRRNLEEAL